MSNNQWVTVYTASGNLAAEMVKLFLLSMGIESRLQQESAGLTYGLTVGDLGAVDIWVSADRVDEALQALRGMESGEFDAGEADLENKDQDPQNQTKD